MENIQQLSKPELERLERISRVELFSTLLDDDLLYVASRTESRTVPEGAVLFSEGEPARQFYVVQTGAVSITSGAAGKNPEKVARYVSGDTFGDFHFIKGSPYDATATAERKTELLVFPGKGQSFDDLSAEKPDTAARILLQSMTMLAARIRSTNRLISENTPWILELQKQMYTDPPTGLWNKDFMDTEIPRKLSGTVAVIMIKPDRFKEINDTLGHTAGDEILSNLAALLMEKASRAPTGWAVRLRSNEMALIIPGCDRSAAYALAESTYNAMPLLVPGLESSPQESGCIPFTASIALGFWPDDNKNWHTVTEQTNQTMHNVWQAGGNRIVFVSEVAR